MGEYGEPWKAEPLGEDKILIKDANRYEVCDSYLLESLNVDDWKAMSRIAACVNALDGVPDEELPMVAEMIREMRKVWTMGDAPAAEDVEVDGG